jgi:hypothetical protein
MLSFDGAVNETTPNDDERKHWTRQGGSDKRRNIGGGERRTLRGKASERKALDKARSIR